MKKNSRFVPSVLAACLLAASGTLLVAGPVAAQPHGIQQRQSEAGIERFVVRTEDQRINAGEDVHFRLAGTARGRATVNIPGVVSGLELRETRPGLYEGRYTVRRSDNPNAFRQATATLRNGRDQDTARADYRTGREWDRDWDRGRDERPPQVTDLSPSAGQRTPEGRVQVSAKLSDAGSGVDARSVRLRLNGRDVSKDARIDANEVQYRADLRPGRYTAEVTARDNAGNPVTRRWEFDVVQRASTLPAPPPPVAVQPPPRPPVVVQPPAYTGPLNLVVTSHPDGAIVNARDNVRLQGQTVPNASVRVQVDNVMANGAVGKVLDLTVNADNAGRFAVDLSPSGFVQPGVRYNVRLVSSVGNRAVEQRLTLNRRG